MEQRILYCISIIFIYKVSFCQLTTNSGQSPNSLVQNVLLGTGVTVSNVIYNGSPTAIGSFTATGTNLGIDQGIVMTTGTVYNNGNGPHGPNNQPGCGIDNNVGGSALLSNIIGGTQTYNAAILEFDFIPFSDTVRFKYVFGSDEYPEFAPPNNSGYNDVFGFFISGPGITGIQNIARLPTNGSVVSINNVNAITNSQFFNFNGDGNSAPYNANPYYIQYDGFTDVLEAVSKVQCGQNYHLIIAVADVGDGQWDSGIFLEANSLTSITPVVVSHQISDQYYSNPNWMAEGCVSATVDITRNSNLNSTLTIPILISGSATNGVDYTGIPNSVTFNPGQSTISFTINTLADALAEGLENIQLVFQLQDPCGNPTPQNLELFIQDVQPLNVTLNNPTIECPGDDIQVSASVSGGLPPYSYLWSNGSTGSSIMVSPSSTGSYWVEVNAQCSSSTASDTVLVNVPVYEPLAVSLGIDISVICPYQFDTLEAQINGGSGSYTINWYQNNVHINGAHSSELAINTGISSIFSIIVSDNCGSTVSDTLTYTILSPPLIVTTTPNPEICPGDSIFISAQASGGYGNYYYHWLHNGANTVGVWVKPSNTSTYIVEVSDDCQTFSVQGFAQVVVVRPNADFIVLTDEPTENLPISFQNLTSNGYSYQWYFGDGGYSNLIHPSNIYEIPGMYYVTLIATDSKGCVDSITKPIYIKQELYIYIPNTFIPDGDRINNVFSGSFIGVKWIELEIYNRWGEKIFETKDLNFAWDGLYDGKMVQDGTYNWLLKYKPNYGDINVITGHINVLH